MPGDAELRDATNGDLLASEGWMLYKRLDLEANLHPS
jgi:hypothetical protein